MFISTLNSPACTISLRKHWIMGLIYSIFLGLKKKMLHLTVTLLVFISTFIIVIKKKYHFHYNLLQEIVLGKR